MLRHNVGAKPHKAPPHRVSVQEPEPWDGKTLDHPADFKPGDSGTRMYEPPPEALRRLQRHDPDMTWAWHPVLNVFTIWRRTATGYTLVMPVWDPATKERIDWDNRVFALLEDSDPRNHGGVKGLRSKAQKWADQRKQAREQRYREMVGEAWHSARLRTRISVGYGRSAGNKFSNHVHPRPSIPEDAKL